MQAFFGGGVPKRSLEVSVAVALVLGDAVELTLVVDASPVEEPSGAAGPGPRR